MRNGQDSKTTLNRWHDNLIDGNTSYLAGGPSGRSRCGFEGFGVSFEYTELEYNRGAVEWHLNHKDSVLREIFKTGDINLGIINI